ncbi:MAG TPA: HDOD domain-containing protein [Nitrospirae bacterium]|nr:HDOD domain-containing protein [Nitrospirota bacterium]
MNNLVSMSKIKKLKALPTLPVILKRLYDVLQDEDSTFCDIAEIIKYDQAITERILRVANSPYFGHSGRIISIEQAVMFLGYDLVKGICLGATTFKLLDKTKRSIVSNLWKHSCEVAIIAANIADQISNVDRAVTFVSGLLHDIGRVVFLSIDSESYLQLIYNEDILATEKAFFDIDHTEAGYSYLSSARLNEEIIATVRFHHSPSLCRDFRETVAVVSLSEGLSRMFFPRFEDDGYWSDELDAVLLELNLDDVRLSRIKEISMAEAAEMEALLTL